VTIVDLLEAALKLGVPVGGLAWFLFYRLYSTGDLDRASNAKSIRKSLKKIKQQKSHIKATDSRWVRLLGQNWMRFGGGFYGIAGLWTFIYIEANDVIRFIANLSQFRQLLDDGLIDLVVDFFVNQLTNFITAIVWFSFWPSGSQSIFLWLAIAYCFYWLGIILARANETLFRKSLAKLKNRFDNSRR